MNNRIQLLAHRCGFTEYRGDDGADDESLTKFAQLIVKECIDVANAGIDPAESHLPGDDIKQHFGVEE